MEKQFVFTEDWFSAHDLVEFLPVGTSDEYHVLEIGSFEGKSTVWFLENLLGNKQSSITCVDPWTGYSQDYDSFSSYKKESTEWNFTSHYDTFVHNVGLTNKWNQVTIRKGLSHLIIPKLITEGITYDMVFIDGNHTSPFVLTDAIMTWYLLKPGGLMIFDDYLGGDDLESRLYPGLAVDSFMKVFADYTEVVWDGWRKAIRKIK